LIPLASLLPFLILGQARPSRAASANIKEERALAILKKCGDTLAAAKSLTFDVRNIAPTQVADGGLVYLVGRAHIAMVRPSKLFVSLGGDHFRQDWYFNDGLLSMFAPDEDAYTQRHYTGDIDTELHEIDSGVGALPFIDAVLSNPYPKWNAKLLRAEYVGESEIVGGKEHHLSLKGQRGRWEIWIDERDNLPRIVLLFPDDEPGHVVVLTEFANWNLTADVAPQTFNFTPPVNATLLDFRVPTARR
jgi:hypothetical protein